MMSTGSVRSRNSRPINTRFHLAQTINVVLWSFDVSSSIGKIAWEGGEGFQAVDIRLVIGRRVILGL